MFEDMPPAGWFVIVAALVVCFGLMAYSYIDGQAQRTEIYSEACQTCREKLEVCISMMPATSGDIIIDFNNFDLNNKVEPIR